MTLIEWLEKKLEENDWRPADLARESGLSPATLSKILNGERRAGPEVCVGIARAFDMNPVIVFRLAGLLPASSEDLRQDDPILDHCCRILASLPKNERILTLRYLRGLAATMKDERREETELSMVDRMALDLARGIRDLSPEDAQRLIDLMERFRAREKRVLTSSKEAGQPATG